MTFKSVRINTLNMNPFTKIGKEWLLITAGTADNCNTMTASWGRLWFSLEPQCRDNLYSPTTLYENICGYCRYVYTQLFWSRFP